MDHMVLNGSGHLVFGKKENTIFNARSEPGSLDS